jgi:hypothetical protein
MAPEEWKLGRTCFTCLLNPNVDKQSATNKRVASVPCLLLCPLFTYSSAIGTRHGRDKRVAISARHLCYCQGTAWPSKTREGKHVLIDAHPRGVRKAENISGRVYF